MFVTDNTIVHSVSQMQKIESCHDANFYVTGGTGRFHYEYLQFIEENPV